MAEDNKDIIKQAKVREPGWWGRCWRWLVGYTRDESVRESELRLALSDREQTIATLREEKAALESALRVRELECRLLADVIERDRRRVQAETVAAGFWAGASGKQGDVR